MPAVPEAKDESMRWVSPSCSAAVSAAAVFAATLAGPLPAAGWKQGARAVDRRYVCEVEALIRRSPGRGPIGVIRRGDRFVIDAFSRSRRWAHGTGTFSSPGSAHRSAGRGWARVSDLCGRRGSPWSALPPTLSPSFLGPRLAAAAAGVVYLSDAGRVVRLAVASRADGGITLRREVLWRADALALAVGPDTRVYAGTGQPERTVQVFSAAGTAVKAFGRRGSKVGELGQPTAVGVGLNGDVYVADLSLRITRFSSSGAVRGQWGGRGGAPGQFGLPLSIAVATGGDVYVRDVSPSPRPCSQRIQRFSASGQFVTQWAIPCASPTAGEIAFGPDGNLYVPGADGTVRAFAIDRAGALYLGTDRLRLFASDGTLRGTSEPRQRYS
jgi:hypothetical protein